MRILVFSPYFDPHVGGVESYVAELNHVLLPDRRVRAVTVLAPALPPGAPPQEERSAGYRVVRYPALELIPNFPMPRVWAPGFWAALRAAGPRRHDVLVSHTRFFVSSALAALCAALTGVPLLHVEHGSDFAQLGGRLPRLVARAYDLSIGRQVLSRADGIVAVSRAAAEFVARLSGRDARVVYRGLRRDRLEATARDVELLGWADGRKVVTFVGRLIAGKGVADLLHAFARGAGDGSVLCLIGDGPCRGDLEALAVRLGIADRVWFRGYVSPEAALAAIAASDVVVNPSYTEGLPTAVLEAAALGRAVLATDVGGTREIVTSGHSAVLVAPRRPQELGEELARLLAAPAWRAGLGARAQTDAWRRFDWDINAEQFVEALRAAQSRYQST